MPCHFRSRCFSVKHSVMEIYTAIREQHHIRLFPSIQVRSRQDMLFVTTHKLINKKHYQNSNGSRGPRLGRHSQRGVIRASSETRPKCFGIHFSHQKHPNLSTAPNAQAPVWTASHNHTFIRPAVVHSVCSSCPTQTRDDESGTLG